jgi:predicted Fe-S protein YdhL (DUF1289 family)
MTLPVSQDQVQSPCIGICQLDVHKVCIGCRRTLAEITIWPYADLQLRREIVHAATLRRAVAGTGRA